MPLLGRYKSNSSSQSPPASGANNNNNSQTVVQQTVANNRQQLCESPLFGIRRQLPTVSDSNNNNSNNSLDNNLVSQQHQATATTTGSSNKQQQQQQLQSVNSNNNNNNNSTGLSSIPQQITRQQIHYAFSIMDSNKDGQVDVRDLSQMLSNLGIPIDEAILSHIMKNTVSKRGDHRISEAEFLDWISHFIEIKSESPSPISNRIGGGQQQQKRSSSAVRATRSCTAGSSSLIAEPNEVPRARRGSGSGLALMRSLSSSSAGTSSKKQHNNNQMNEHSQSIQDKNKKSSSSSSTSNNNNNNKPSLQHQSSTDSIEAKNDLKAAFCVFDLDGDGFITLDEVRAGLKLLGESWSPLELKRVFSKCSNSSTTSDLSKQRISIDDFVQLLL